MSKRLTSVVLLIAVLSLTLSMSASAAPLRATCNPLSGCVVRENGSNARWWADSWYKGTCGSGSGNWIVTYKTDNTTWRNADISKMRYYAAWWSKYVLYPWAATAQVVDNKTPGIVLCLGSAAGLTTSSDVSGTWVWLKP
jgi:hypothetical protein